MDIIRPFRATVVDVHVDKDGKEHHSLRPSGEFRDMRKALNRLGVEVDPFVGKFGHTKDLSRRGGGVHDSLLKHGWVFDPDVLPA